MNCAKFLNFDFSTKTLCANCFSFCTSDALPGPPRPHWGTSVSRHGL